jgi:hypothetical protein
LGTLWLVRVRPDTHWAAGLVAGLYLKPTKDKEAENKNDEFYINRLEHHYSVQHRFVRKNKEFSITVNLL